MMQILIGLNDAGHLRHIEMLAALGPLQIAAVARARALQFPRVEVWEDAICVARLSVSPSAATG
jgi:hypothetical protein